MSGSAPSGSLGLEAKKPEAQTAEVLVVILCMNEADRLRSCIESAQRALRVNGIRGEIIVADNASPDGSADIARAGGVRVTLGLYPVPFSLVFEGLLHSAARLRG
jgi:hypothetical protein